MDYYRVLWRLQSWFHHMQKKASPGMLWDAPPLCLIKINEFLSVSNVTFYMDKPYKKRKITKNSQVLRPAFTRNGRKLVSFKEKGGGDRKTAKEDRDEGVIGCYILFCHYLPLSVESLMLFQGIKKACTLPLADSWVRTSLSLPLSSVFFLGHRLSALKLPKTKSRRKWKSILKYPATDI